MSPSSRPLAIASLAGRALRSTTTTACHFTTSSSRCYYIGERRNIRGKPSEPPFTSSARSIFSNSHRKQQQQRLSTQIRWKSEKNNSGRSDDDVGVPEFRFVSFEEVELNLFFIYAVPFYDCGVCMRKIFTHMKRYNLIFNCRS